PPARPGCASTAPGGGPLRSPKASTGSAPHSPDFTTPAAPPRREHARKPHHNRMPPTTPPPRHRNQQSPEPQPKLHPLWKAKQAQQPPVQRPRERGRLAPHRPAQRPAYGSSPKR